MLKATLLIVRSIGLAHEAWRTKTARRRPLRAELDARNEELSKAHAEIDLLRSRLLRLAPYKRPHYKGWERLGILIHQAR